MYAEFAHDPKVQMLSEAMQRRLVMLFCLRCSNDSETLLDEEVAFQLRISADEVAETKALFLKKEFIGEQWQILAWDKRQFLSDCSYERVKRHREKRVSEGLPQQNSIPKTVRLAVYKKDGNSCVYCGSKDDLTIDHNLPQSRGGSNDISNLLTACRACNAGKRDLTHDEYIERNGLVTLQKRSHIQKQNTDTEKDIPAEKASPQIPTKSPSIKPTAKKKTPIPHDFEISDRVFQWAQEKGFRELDRHLERFVGACKAKGYTYVDWDEGFMGAIRDNWAKVEIKNDKKREVVF